MTEKTKYFEAIGRRKTARARVRLFKATSQSFEINTKELEDYFPTEDMCEIVRGTLGAESKYKVTAKLSGGGIHAQAEALRHGIARALCVADPLARTEIKRDSRSKERRKFGLKKARKSPQWSKR